MLPPVLQDVPTLWPTVVPCHSIVRMRSIVVLECTAKRLAIPATKTSPHLKRHSLLPTPLMVSSFFRKWRLTKVLECEERSYCSQFSYCHESEMLRDRMINECPIQCRHERCKAKWAVNVTKAPVTSDEVQNGDLLFDFEMHFGAS